MLIGFLTIALLFSYPFEKFLQHMVLGGIPLAAVSILAHDPTVSGGLNELTTNDLLALLYTSVFGSAISYGLYFYNATRGNSLFEYVFFLLVYFIVTNMYILDIYQAA